MMNALEYYETFLPPMSVAMKHPTEEQIPCKATVLGVQPHRSQRTGKAASILSDPCSGTCHLP